MRLWSLHPNYLDAKGLVALWREGLLAQKVLLGQTKGYRQHPQLHRFRLADDPVTAIGAYLAEIVNEAAQRGYRFDGNKIMQASGDVSLSVTAGQVEYEWHHLSAKLKVRSPATYERHSSVAVPAPHPIFTVVPGPVESWERP